MAQRLNLFCSQQDTANITIKKNNIPYSQVVSYYGYLDSSWAAVDTLAGIKVYYLYFNLPRSTGEIGLRMFSPVPEYAFPDKGDIVAKGYYDFIKTNKGYFDPWITFEHQVELKSSTPSDSIKQKKEWITFGENDDNEELLAQPSGKKTNALVRINSDTTQFFKTLDAGLYRVGISSLKDTLITGSFVLQIGTSVIQPKMKITRTETELLIK